MIHPGSPPDSMDPLTILLISLTMLLVANLVANRFKT